MQISLSPGTEQLLVARMKAAGFTTADETVHAALLALQSQEGEFEPGELDRLLAEGEAGGESLDGEAVLEELRRLRQASARQVG